METKRQYDPAKIITAIALLFSVVVFLLIFDKEKAKERLNEFKKIFSCKKETA